MTARRLKPTGNYHGPVWGPVPQAYPTEQAERVYRYLLDQMPTDSIPRALMGHGFKGVAYRFRATTEYQSEFETLFYAPGGVAPPSDDYYRQERALFGFFVSGLSCIESFAFALHAIGSFYRPSTFRLTEESLRKVSPNTVAKALEDSYPCALVTIVINRLVEDATFQTWKEIRNVLSHRAVPPRDITFSLKSGMQSTWNLMNYQHSKQDEPLDAVTRSRALWLRRCICDLWDGVEQSFPPP